MGQEWDRARTVQGASMEDQEEEEEGMGMLDCYTLMGMTVCAPRNCLPTLPTPIIRKHRARTALHLVLTTTMITQGPSINASSSSSGHSAPRLV